MTKPLGYTVRQTPEGYVFVDPEGVSPPSPGAPYATEAEAWSAAEADYTLFSIRPTPAEFGVTLH